MGSGAGQRAGRVQQAGLSGGLHRLERHRERQADRIAGRRPLLAYRHLLSAEADEVLAALRPRASGQGSRRHHVRQQHQRLREAAGVGEEAPRRHEGGEQLSLHVRPEGRRVRSASKALGGGDEEVSGRCDPSGDPDPSGDREEVRLRLRGLYHSHPRHAEAGERRAAAHAVRRRAGAEQRISPQVAARRSVAVG